MSGASTCETVTFVVAVGFFPTGSCTFVLLLVGCVHGFDSYMVATCLSKGFKHIFCLFCRLRSCFQRIIFHCAEFVLDFRAQTSRVEANDKLIVFLLLGVVYHSFLLVIGIVHQYFSTFSGTHECLGTRGFRHKRCCVNQESIPEGQHVFIGGLCFANNRVEALFLGVVVACFERCDELLKGILDISV